MNESTLPSTLLANKVALVEGRVAFWKRSRRVRASLLGLLALPACSEAAEFAYVAEEGFGWMNASVLVGLGELGPRHRRALDALEPPEAIW